MDASVISGKVTADLTMPETIQKKKLKKGTDTKRKLHTDTQKKRS